jgi:bla regulator protein BlaR1
MPARIERHARHFIKHMMRLVGALFITCGLFGQAANSPPATPAAFTVASIKPNKSDDNRFMLRPLPGGGLTASGVTLRMLIMNAYEVAGYQISGAPSWIGTERWDIEAKTEGVQGPLPREQFGAMLRRLIEDRFQMKTRRESKEMPVYALVVTKTGSKLKPHPGDAAERRPLMKFGRGSATFTNTSLAVLAGQLSMDLGRPVLDRTNLMGGFDFTLEWTPAPEEGGSEAFGIAPRAEPASPADSTGPSIFTAIQEQLGLKLESQKGPVDILVIDHVERPSEN